MSTDHGPYGLFTAALEIMLAKAPDDGKATYERMLPALQRAGFADLAEIVAKAMVVASNATADELEKRIVEQQADDDEIGDGKPPWEGSHETASPDRVSHWPPVVLSRCADCEAGTHTLGERYMVRDEVWRQAWKGRDKAWQHAPGQMVLCVGCLEQRLGRKLIATDFAAVPLNDPSEFHMSPRLLDRLKRPSARIGNPQRGALRKPRPRKQKAKGRSK
jgi:hypothetical protein